MSGERICPHCETGYDAASECDCDGATVDKLTDLLAAFRGKRAVTAEGIYEAEGWLEVAWKGHGEEL